MGTRVVIVHMSQLMVEVSNSVSEEVVLETIEIQEEVQVETQPRAKRPRTRLVNIISL